MVFGSLAEGFGLPLVEAAAAGAASLLVSDIEVFRWICGDEARYVDPASVAEITPGLRTEIAGRRAARLDLTRFDWDVSAQVIATACENVARETPSTKETQMKLAVVLASAGRADLLAEASRTPRPAGRPVRGGGFGSRPGRPPG